MYSLIRLGCCWFDVKEDAVWWYYEEVSIHVRGGGPASDRSEFWGPRLCTYYT